MTMVDILLLLGATGNLLAGVRRGFGRELIHGLLYGIAVGLGVLYMQLWPLPATAAEAGTYLINFSYYMVITYIITWAMMTFGAPMVLGDGRPGVASRLAAVALAALKIVVSVLGLNLYLAMHSPDAHPLRLRALPGFMRDSWIVQTSDAYTDRIYRELAAAGLVKYQKFTERRPNETERKIDAVERMILSTKPE